MARDEGIISGLSGDCSGKLGCKYNLTIKNNYVNMVMRINNHV